MKEVLFVDGYNIINAWPDLIEACKVNLEFARDMLVSFMAEYRSYKGIEVYVVFDAFRVKDSIMRKDKINGVNIVYTKHGETADHYIEKSISHFTKSYVVKVATSDWVEQQVIMAQGGIRVPASELLQEYKRIKREIKKSHSSKQGKDVVWETMPQEVLEKLKKYRHKN